MAYQWLMVALYMPFLDRLSWRRPLEAALCGLLVPLSAMAVFPLAFDLLHSDALLGVMGGFVCAYPFLDGRRDRFSLATMGVLLFVLVLTKEAGLLYALAGVATAVLCTGSGRPSRRTLVQAGLMLLCVAVAKGSWAVHVAATNAAAQSTFSDPISLSVLLAPDQAWRRTTLRNFLYQFFESIVPVQGTDGNISYFVAFVILGAGFGALYAALRRRGAQKETAAGFKRLWGVVFATAALYIVGTGLTYTFKFFEDEAVRLGSYTRYLNIAVMAVFFVLFVCAVRLREPALPGGLTRRGAALALAAFMLFAPFTRLLNAVTRLDAQAAYEKQEGYLAMEQRVRALAVRGDERIYIIAAGSGGFEHYVMRYRLRPLYVGDEPWNIVDGRPAENRFMAQRTPEAFWQCLSEGYDLVVLYTLTDEFQQTYGSLFQDPQTMAEGQIYRVDREAQQLVLAQ